QPVVALVAVVKLRFRRQLRGGGFRRSLHWLCHGRRRPRWRVRSCVGVVFRAFTRPAVVRHVSSPSASGSAAAGPPAGRALGRRRSRLVHLRTVCTPVAATSFVPWTIFFDTSPAVLTVVLPARLTMSKADLAMVSLMTPATAFAPCDATDGIICMASAKAALRTVVTSGIVTLPL